MTDERFAQLADLVIDIAREIRIRGSAGGRRSAPLTQTQSHVMRHVHNNPGCTSSGIADATGLRRANVSATLGELRDLGFVRSRPDEYDGRSIRIEPTKKAVDMIDRLRHSWGDLLAESWGDEGVRGQASLDRVIARLESVMEELAESRATKRGHGRM